MTSASHVGQQRLTTLKAQEFVSRAAENERDGPAVVDSFACLLSQEFGDVLGPFAEWDVQHLASVNVHSAPSSA